MASGCEWIIEAHGCGARDLADLSRLRGLFDHLIGEMGLHPVAETTWHQFPVTGGVTGLSLLRESHIACHTFPEYGSLCLNVFCCVPRAESDFESYLKQEFGASSVIVRRIERPYGDA
jgi:S-adenosylmethionine decarboxylase